MKETAQHARETKRVPRWRAFLEWLLWVPGQSLREVEQVVRLESGDWARLPDKLAARILLNSSQASGTTPTEPEPSGGEGGQCNLSQTRGETSGRQTPVTVRVWRTPDNAHPSPHRAGVLLLEVFVAGSCVVEPPNDPSSATAAPRRADCNRDGPPPFAAANG